MQAASCTGAPPFLDCLHSSRLYCPSTIARHCAAMARRHHLHTLHRQKRRYRKATGWRTIGDYFIAAIMLGGAVGLGLTMWDGYRARKAALTALPPGFVFSGCDEVRARGLAPLESYERGYGPHMDGDHDGTACEPYP